MRKRYGTLAASAALVAAAVTGCTQPTRTVWISSAATPRVSAAASPPATPSPTPTPTATPTPKPTPVPKNGNPDGHATIPADARAVDTSHPNHVIGHGTPASCTSAALVKAVGEGGIITFDCGPAPVTITMAATAKVINAHGPRIVIDGGNLVTLDGGGKRRILYMDTCDPAQGWTTSHCQDQSTPLLTVQHLTFAHGNSTGQTYEGGGGGAIFDRGGRLKVVDSRFVGNRCDNSGPDLGGAAIRALSQYHNLPVYVVDSTFTGGICSNGGGLSSIGVSWTVLNCVFTHNQAIGDGANPAQKGSPGGGSGGAIYNDGDTYVLTIDGTVIENNTANEGGGAIFYVSNDHTGTMSISYSTLTHNHSGKFQNFPGIFFLGKHDPTVTHSTLK